MNFYYNTPHSTDITTIISLAISIIALAFSWTSLYFQFFRKKKSLILNIFPYDLNDFSTLFRDFQHDVARNKISLSNSGNVPLLLISINYQTVDNRKANEISSSEHQTNVTPNNFPILLKPGETVLYDVTSNPDFFLHAISQFPKVNGSHNFNVYLKFRVVVYDKSANYRILAHETKYYDSEKVHNLRSNKLSGINILDKKHQLDT